MIWQRKELGHRIMLASSRIESPRSIGPIAVLPFSNMSGDPEQDYFSDGISEDIITALVLILPDGQITSGFQKSCQAPFAKIFSFAFDPNQFTDSCRPVPQEGRLAIVTNAGRDAMDVGSARDERGLLAYGQVVSF